eukprot:CAMPEP_0172429188 /NCGR_PEP_ID=MMETSP1064-20121228/49449_1 /TAXON_ID=202472 /ORGANISM="Aulacoseira subarctica , Strain CCAP 1002/5" /LENGTH=55 /DNA_ID=CAMNT_0013174433 /DNA_START=14 /DNA_END=178 /DNA_ORIENTATION=+
MSLSSFSASLIGSSLFVFSLTLIFGGFVFCGYPKSYIGLRHHGVIGYDAILGTFP